MAEKKIKEEIVEVQEKKQTFSDVLTTSLMGVKEGLPCEFNIPRFVNNAIALLNENEQLGAFAKQYGTNQIKAGLMKSAFLGLDAMSKECYLIPYKNQLQFQIDYRGAKKLAKLYSIRPIKDIYAEIVRQGDEFKYWSDDEGQHYVFNPIPFNEGAIIGAFAVVKYEDGGVQVDKMSLSELENSRNQSRASDSPAWTKFTSEMYRKTVLHRLTKHIELNFENPNQRQLWDGDMEIKTEEDVVSDVPDPTEDDDIIDVEVVNE